jgi:hypothetical protein
MWRKLGLIAGAGALPQRIAETTAGRGEGVFVLRLAGIADGGTAAFPGAEVGMGEAGKIIRLLKENGCDAVVLAGRVRRPDFSSLKADWRGATLLPKVVAAAAKGDGALLSVLVETLDEEGVRVIGPEQVLRELAAPQGALTARRPSAAEMEDIRKAAAVVAALGPFDVGQGAVVADGLVLAIEAAEGTDAMLDRCAALPRVGAPRGVLVKRPKPGQERRIDLPVIGAETMRRASVAGLAGVAVEAGGALIIDQADTLREAEAAGLFVYGFSSEDVA